MKKFLIMLALCTVFTGCSTETATNDNSVVFNSVVTTETTTKPTATVTTTTTVSTTKSMTTTETTTTTTENTTVTMAKIIPTEIIIPVVTTTTTTTKTPVATTAADSYYELPTVVTEFDEVVDVVFVDDANGNRYAFFGIEDWEVGDIAVLTMRDLTAYEENDEIVSVRYVGTISE